MNARLAGCLVLVSLFLGCGKSVDANRPKTAPVTGIVTYNGQPVEGASVTFMTQSSEGHL